MKKVDDPLVPIAIDVFSRLGIKKGTMADVAAAAGVSRQTVYNRFANKDEVLRAATKFLSTRQLAQMQSDWEAAPDLAAKLEIFYEAGPLFWHDMICKAPDAADLIEGIYSAAAQEMAEGHIKWRGALAQMLHPYSNQLGTVGMTTEDLADFLYASAQTAKTDAIDRDHLLRRLATLKAAVLALTQAE